ncbi:MAG: hypothetical protein N3G19_01105 [Candidatus Pacearchaeota archaeon]|nr:hypothetical protein [Candidatus Pacearchaeota archaeon]
MPKKVPVDVVLKLTRQGYNDAEIIKYLRSEGYSATEINDAINQAKIKMELARTAGMEPEEAIPEAEAYPEEYAEEEMLGEEMQPSIMEEEYAPAPEVAAPGAYPEGYTPEYVEEGEYTPVPSAEAPAPAEEAPMTMAPGAAPEAYPAYYYQPTTTTPAEAVEELAEEIINEKWEEFKAKVGDISELKSHIEARFKNIEDRMKRLESSFDKVQMNVTTQTQQSIRDVKALGTEFEALQQVFSQIMQPLMSSVKELRELTEEIKEIKEKKPEKVKAKKEKIKKVAENLEKIEKLGKKK